jgi:hypothetical protein
MMIKKASSIVITTKKRDRADMAIFPNMIVSRTVRGRRKTNPARINLTVIFKCLKTIATSYTLIGI